MDEWWTEIDTDILGSLGGNGAMASAELGLQLGISEGATTSLLSTLAQEREGLVFAWLKFPWEEARDTSAGSVLAGDGETVKWKNDRL